MKLTLCESCQACPEVKLIKRGRKVQITDDFGGKVVLTRKEYELLLEKGDAVLKK